MHRWLCSASRDLFLPFRERDRFLFCTVKDATVHPMRCRCIHFVCCLEGAPPRSLWLLLYHILSVHSMTC